MLYILQLELLLFTKLIGRSLINRFNTAYHSIRLPEYSSSVNHEFAIFHHTNLVKDNSLWDRKIDFKTDMLSNDGCEPAVKSTNSVDKPSCILPQCP
ncbi:hypothetical protein T4A_8909 [Trichinella pseudospiralis]|uniref:Uncharacterized protein n=1 Tax=Trichinella pseudospiralis TaxID=6337 RepID=A0A0V1EFP5_TRIPS|nr:hypothetical protein T4A_8909 [Trichinella pseudospiralis]